jgi:transcriptional regulator with XRE-family HTH domain
MTQEDMGRFLGLTHAAIAKYETGARKLPIHVLIAMSRALRTKGWRILRELEK